MVTMDLRVLTIILKTILLTECACPTSKKVVNLCEEAVKSGLDFHIDSVNMAADFEKCSCKLFAEKTTRIKIKDDSSSPKCQSYKYETNITLLGDYKLISYRYANGQCEFPVFIGGSIGTFDHWMITIKRLFTDLDNSSSEDPGFCLRVSSDQGGYFTVRCEEPVSSVPESTTIESVTEITQTTTDDQGLKSTDIIPEISFETRSTTTVMSLTTTPSNTDKEEPVDEEDERVSITDPVIIVTIVAVVALLIVLLVACIYKKRKCARIYRRKDVENIVYIPEPKHDQ